MNIIMIHYYPDYDYNYCSLTLDSGSKSGCSGACFNRNTINCTGNSMDVVEKVL